jgi:hypothetical protein|tara:strand:+ start:768 stop:1010 length:243 start_codon:yes stop_codon:yes gene_type:complete
MCANQEESKMTRQEGLEVLRREYPEIPEDDNNYRIFKMNEGFTFDMLSESDIKYYKTINNFVDDDKLVVVEQSKIVYAEE